MPEYEKILGLVVRSRSIRDSECMAGDSGWLCNHLHKVGSSVIKSKFLGAVEQFGPSRSQFKSYIN